MSFRKFTAASAASLAMILLGTAVTGVHANELKFSSPTDPQTMDPHAVNSAPVLGFLNNVYEGLVRRGKDMAIEGALAERWEPLGDKGWRFHLRKNVVFHDGSAFDASDVLFSYQRANSEDADVRSWFAPVSDVVVVDEFTVDFMTIAPNPIFPDSIANFMIMDKEWAAANGTERPSREADTFATLNANGTGAFKLSSREPGIRTVLEPFPDWWDKAEHNITSATFLPIPSSATAVAALLSGEIDVINPVPLQDVPRLKGTDGLTVHEGIEARVIMLGFGHEAAALKYADAATDKNPFADPRVRKAVYQAIDADAIVARIMRGNAEPASLLVSPAMRGYSPGLSARHPHGSGCRKGAACRSRIRGRVQLWPDVPQRPLHK